MKILHIDGTGFLGSHILRKVIDRNHDLSIITRNPDIGKASRLPRRILWNWFDIKSNLSI